MKKRSAIAVYFLMWLTCGFYLFYWLFSLIEEINRFRKQEVLNYKKITTKFIVTFLLFCITFITLLYLMSENNQTYGFLFFFCFCLGIYWFILIIGTIRKIGKEILQIQQEQNTAKLISIPLLTFLFFIYYFAFPYLQSNINKITIEPKDTTKFSKKSLQITGVMFLIVFIGISIGGISILSNAGLLTANKNKNKKIDITNTINGSSTTKISITNPGEYALWVVLDLKYKEPTDIILDIKITINGEVLFDEKCNPFDSSLIINSRKTTLMNNTSYSFSGLLRKIDLPDIGEYDIEVTSFFDKNVETVSNFLIYLK